MPDGTRPWDGARFPVGGVRRVGMPSPGSRWRGALSLAAATDEDALYRSLCKQGAWAESLGPLNKEDALLSSCQAGREVCIKLLLSAKANVNAKDRLGRPPLLLASSEKITQMLLVANADSDATDNNGWTAIMWACRENRLKQI